MWQAERGSKEGLQAAINALGLLWMQSPSTGCPDALSRSYYFMADGYTQDDEAEGLFETGVYYGERAMAADASSRPRSSRAPRSPTP